MTRGEVGVETHLAADGDDASVKSVSKRSGLNPPGHDMRRLIQRDDFDGVGVSSVWRDPGNGSVIAHFVPELSL